MMVFLAFASRGVVMWCCVKASGLGREGQYAVVPRKQRRRVERLHGGIVCASATAVNSPPPAKRRGGGGGGGGAGGEGGRALGTAAGKAGKLAASGAR